MEFLKNLQKKPEKDKKKIMWTVIIIIAISIFVCWLLLPKSHLNKEGEQMTFDDIKNLYFESEENKKFDEYMNSLGILNNLEEQTDFNKIFEGASNKEEENGELTAEEAQLLHDQTNIKFEYGKIRLPLEPDKE